MSDSVRPQRWQPTRLHRPWDSPGQNTGVGSLFLLQGIFPTQGSNPGLPHGRHNLRYADDTILMAESKEELKSLLRKVKEESEKDGLKLNIQEMKTMPPGSITSWQIDGETMETVRDFILLGSQITADGDCSHEIKRHPAISSSVVPFSSCPQSLPASESFPMSQLFATGGQSTGVSALASFLPKKSQG